MKVVIDTNVLVSAILRDRSPEQVVLFVLDNDKIEWVASQEIIAEYLEVLCRPKFRLPTDILNLWSERLKRAIIVVEAPGVIVDFPRDPKDARFLACALASQADFLITGDRDFSGAQAILSTRIVSVSQFQALIPEHDSD